MVVKSMESVAVAPQAPASADQGGKHGLREKRGSAGHPSSSTESRSDHRETEPEPHGAREPEPQTGTHADVWTQTRELPPRVSPGYCRQSQIRR